jgi:hypothetical protein
MVALVLELPVRNPKGRKRETLDGTDTRRLSLAIIAVPGTRKSRISHEHGSIDDPQLLAA